MRANNRDEFLRYYVNELTYLRRMGSAFAEEYPRVAQQLELGKDECADPQVERLIESFAFLTARLQHDLDGEFPEITTSLLGALYPQFVNPVPSMTVAQFKVDPEQANPTTAHTIEKHTTLFINTTQELPCRFRTCYPVNLWPLEVTAAEFKDAQSFDFLDAHMNVASVLRLEIKCPGKASFSEFENLTSLRFYLNGHSSLVNALYELLFAHEQWVAIRPDKSTHPDELPRGSVVPVGFGLHEDVLPYPPNAHPGYRLIHEYFAFPQKYFFFDIVNLDTKNLDKTLDLLIMLDRAPRENMTVDHQNFLLGCTPIINLFRKTSEPIRLDHRSLEYPLVPDKRREKTTEVHSITAVSSSSNIDDQTKKLEPFFSYNHNMDSIEHKAFWHARRVPTGRKDMPGTEMLLTFLDLDFKPSLPPLQTVYAHTLCTNRELAAQLDDRAELQMDIKAPQYSITCVMKPTAPRQPPLGGSTVWCLISHLSLNYLSLSNDSDSLTALREILKLYSFSDRPSTRQQIIGIREMSCRKVIRHLTQLGGEASRGEEWRGFCRGTEITLGFDEDSYEGSGAFLLGAVLSRFFGLYASINSFTQLKIKSRQREGIWKTWPPMAGEKITL